MPTFLDWVLVVLTAKAFLTRRLEPVPSLPKAPSSRSCGARNPHVLKYTPVSVL